jgi:SAM-dependent methyltransferase
MGDVREYYDRNTRGFLRFGQGGTSGAIHRAVWAPGVLDRGAAFRYVDDRILETLAETERDPFVIDLGCGVGSSLSHLATSRSLRGVGITISAVQVELARQRFAAAGLGDRLRCIAADFTHLPTDLGAADLVYAIESFVHGPGPAAFFEQAARVVRPGGHLVVCDDFLSSTGARADLPKRHRRWLDEFRQGWHLGSLVGVESADRAANDAGFSLERDEDWTPWLELERLRDRVIATAVRLGRPLRVHHPWWQNLVGGHALQRSILAGLVEYHFLVWRRDTTARPTGRVGGSSGPAPSGGSSTT